MRYESADQLSESWDAGYRVETARLSISPCDALSSREAVGVMADRLVHEPYCGGRSTHLHCRDREAYWAQHVDDYPLRGRMTLAAWEHDNAAFVGMVRFDKGWLNYFVSPRYWGRGYGTEMVAACCRVMPCLLKLPRIHASVIRDNIGSKRILEKIGFTFVGLANRSWHGRPGSAVVLNYRLHTAAIDSSLPELSGKAEQGNSTLSPFPLTPT